MYRLTVPSDGESTRMDTIKTVASVISACAIVVAVVQFFLARRVWKSQHERARRDKAISILYDFVRSDNCRWAATSKLVEQLNARQIKALEQGKAFRVQPALQELVCAAIPSYKPVKQGRSRRGRATAEISRRQSFMLRWEALSYLNAVEIVCQAWVRDVAHRSTIEDEMAFLYDEERNESVMKSFRDVNGGRKFYPAIYAFVDNLIRERERRPDAPLAPPYA